MDFKIGAVVRAEDGRIGVVIDAWPLVGAVGGDVIWEPLLAGRTSEVQVADVTVVPLERIAVPA